MSMRRHLLTCFVHERELVISQHNSHKSLNLLSVDIILIKFMIQLDRLLHVVDMVDEDLMEETRRVSIFHRVSTFTKDLVAGPICMPSGAPR